MALNERGVGKICNFHPISRYISETVQKLRLLRTLVHASEFAFI